MKRTAVMYHAELGVTNFIDAKTIGVGTITLPSETIFSSQLKVDTFFGIPRSVSPGGLAMDADRLLNVVKALDGDNNRAVQFMLNSGMSSSALEHEVPEKLFSTPGDPAEGISAVKAIKIANDQGIPIYMVDQSNMASVLPHLQIDLLAKMDIQNAVNTGKVVTVPKENISFNGWNGCGYIIINPDTGAGAYMISGGLSGALLILKFITWVIASIVSAITAIKYHFWHGALATILIGVMVVTIQKIIDASYSISFRDIALYITSVIAWTSVGGAFGPLISFGPAGWIALAMLILSVVLLDIVMTYAYIRKKEFNFIYANTPRLLIRGVV